MTADDFGQCWLTLVLVCTPAHSTSGPRTPKDAPRVLPGRAKDSQGPPKDLRRDLQDLKRDALGRSGAPLGAKPAPKGPTRDLQALQKLQKSRIRDHASRLCKTYNWQGMGYPRGSLGILLVSPSHPQPPGPPMGPPRALRDAPATLRTPSKASMVTQGIPKGCQGHPKGLPRDAQATPRDPRGLAGASKSSSKAPPATRRHPTVPQSSKNVHQSTQKCIFCAPKATKFIQESDENFRKHLCLHSHSSSFL